MRLSDATLRGMTVISSDGQTIGEIAAMFLNAETWRVESLQVKLHPEIADRLGASRGTFRPGKLEVAIGHVQSVGDTLVLSVDVESLRHSLPGQGDPVQTH